MLARNVLSHVRRTIDGVPVSNLFDPPGRKLGWAHHEERRVIREHVAKRWSAELHTMEWFRREERVSRIQRRLHRHDLRYRELQVLYKRKWARDAAARPPSVEFTVEELERIAEHFEMANDPLSRAVWAKALRGSTVVDEPPAA